VRANPELNEQLDVALSGLGVVDKTAQGRLLVAELRGTVDEVRAVRRAMTGRRGLAYGAVALLLLMVPALVALYVPSWSARIAGTGVLTSLGAVLFGALDLTRRARSGLASLRGLADELRQASRAGAQADVAGKIDRLRAAETQQQVSETKLDAVVSQVAELDRELAELAPGRRLYTFLAQRAESEAYRGSLA
jgi:hypothetical protein